MKPLDAAVEKKEAGKRADGEHVFGERAVRALPQASRSALG